MQTQFISQNPLKIKLAMVAAIALSMAVLMALTPVSHHQPPAMDLAGIGVRNSVPTQIVAALNVPRATTPLLLVAEVAESAEAAAAAEESAAVVTRFTAQVVKVTKQTVKATQQLNKLTNQMVKITAKLVLVKLATKKLLGEHMTYAPVDQIEQAMQLNQL